LVDPEWGIGGSIAKLIGRCQLLKIKMLKIRRISRKVLRKGWPSLHRCGKKLMALKPVPPAQPGELPTTFLKFLAGIVTTTA
jgi:hypothetical protein